MKKIVLLFFTILLLFTISCNNNKNHEFNYENDYYSEEEGYKDGTYCAEVEYYNPSTGTRKTYDLNVDVSNGQLTVIHWPNGGWLDNTHFTSEDISSGECNFTSDRGYQYTVTLGEFGGCAYTDEFKIRRDVNDEVEDTTCPKCGYDKDSYEEYCHSCRVNINNERQNTCPSCGVYEYGIFGDVCSNCKSDNE